VSKLEQYLMSRENLLNLPPEYLRLGQYLVDVNVGVFLSLDIDVADSAYAPGIQYPGPVGGLAASQARRAVRLASMAGVDCSDVVEVVPAYDRADRACLLAASSVLDFLAGLAYKRKAARKG
jgi:agmatinase